MKRFRLSSKFILGCVIFFLGLYSYSINKVTENQIQVDENYYLFVHFKEVFREKTVIIAGLADVNDDGREDLALIYQKELNEVAVLVVLDKEDGPIFTEEVKAPIENQEIRFDDIDEKPPTEIIVTGSKDGHYSYRVFRLYDDKYLRDIFSGANMEKC